MKKTIISALATVCLLINLPSASAQQTTKPVSIENLLTSVTGEMLDISFTVKASGVEIRCDGQLTLEFSVENADRRLVLPVVIYSGATRYRYEQRRALLSDGYQVEPYHVYKGIKKNRTYELYYKLSVPYYAWMEHASVTCREYLHDCSGDRRVADDVLVADLNPAPTYIEPEIWKPDPTLFPNLVSFLDPQVEEVKARASMIELPIGFPVNVTEVRPSFGNNAYELQRADSLVRILESNELLTINSVSIHGYASPEGAYAANEKLARGRSESFKQYLVKTYPNNQFVRNAQISWTPEDWNGFARMVEADNAIAQKQEILSIVRDREIASDTKDRMLQTIAWWSSNYKTILTEMYPKLRRIELKADYTVQKLSDSQARELLFTNPDMLSLDEMFRVAKYYTPGSQRYRQAYEIAVRQYPNDVTSNNNAAAALLQEGNAEAALPYLEKTKGNPGSYINYGAYYYIMGDPDKALEYFTMAKGAGVEQADHNLRLIKGNK